MRASLVPAAFLSPSALSAGGRLGPALGPVWAPPGLGGFFLPRPAGSKSAACAAETAENPVPAASARHSARARGRTPSAYRDRGSRATVQPVGTPGRRVLFRPTRRLRVAFGRRRIQRNVARAATTAK